MSSPIELEHEHAALLSERAQLQKLCMDEWPVMPAQVAHQRQGRLWAIRDRLQQIERTKGWRGRAS